MGSWGRADPQRPGKDRNHWRDRKDMNSREQHTCGHSPCGFQVEHRCGARRGQEAHEEAAAAIQVRNEMVTTEAGSGLALWNLRRELTDEDGAGKWLGIRKGW